MARICLFLIFISTILGLNRSFSQSSWKEVQKNKKGSVEIHFYDSENYISYKNGKLTGVEYDLFLAFVAFVEDKYNVELDKKFIHSPSFGGLFNKIKTGKSGQFGACSFSITAKRMLDVNFSPKYMPDIEVMVCSKNFPIVEDTASFIREFKNATALVVKNTTFEEDLMQIKKILPSLKVKYTKTGIEILEKINSKENYFGFSELPNYILSFEKGLKLKRQSLFRFERMGLGFIFPKSSDWNEPIEAFFKDVDFKQLMNIILKKHLGNDINDLLWEMSDDRTDAEEINLLNKELEIQRIELQKTELESKNQAIITNIFIISILFVILIVIFLIYINRKNEKKNIILNSQKIEIFDKKREIEESNKNVIDSINYAKRIQESILPSTEYFHSIFPESFVIYKPKDILSGDFYFIGHPRTEQGVKYKILAVGDCTGHGVPGALLTIIGNTFLQLSLTEQKVNSCSDALNYLNKGLANILKNKLDTVKDGMDIAMIAINSETLQMQYSGGNNPCYIVRNKKVIKLDCDKFGVGELQRNGEELIFKNIDFQLETNDVLYVFTDGFVDQFGGSESYNGGKKYKISRFKELLESISQEAMDEQKIIIEKSFIDWKRNLEQVDDVCIVGIRI